MAATRHILGPNGKPLARGFVSVKSRYDSAQTTAENSRHWAWADSFSARAANNSRVRWVLRNRSRYEAANNCYAGGLAETLADDLVGAGPNLEMRTGEDALDKRIEDAFWEWSCAVGLADKLHTMRQARAVDGEAFLFFDSDPALGRIQLDLRLYEADQVSTPFPWPLDPRAVDGIVFDANMKPRTYHLLRIHPGDDLMYGYAYEFDPVPARFVIHWYLRKRPGQYRGVPEFTPALPLFAQLRRFTLAVLTAAEVAAEYSAVLQSDLPPDEDGEAGDDDAVPMEAFAVERGMMATLPAGWKMNQFRPEQPASTYEMFKRELLNEIARALKVPYNVAAGNSSGYNYASGRLDHQSYYRAIGVDQARLEREVLDRILMAWLQEAARATDLIPGGVAGLERPGGWYHRWLWPGLEHVDPVKEAMAQQIRLRNGMTSFSEECYRDGVDPVTRRKSMKEDMEGFEAMGLPYPYLTDTSAAAMAMGDDPSEDPGEEADDAPPPKKQPAVPRKAAANGDARWQRNGFHP